MGKVGGREGPGGGGNDWHSQDPVTPSQGQNGALSSADSPGDQWNFVVICAGDVQQRFHLLCSSSMLYINSSVWSTCSDMESCKILCDLKGELRQRT